MCQLSDRLAGLFVAHNTSHGKHSPCRQQFSDMRSSARPSRHRKRSSKQLQRMKGFSHGCCCQTHSQDGFTRVRQRVLKFYPPPHFGSLRFSLCHTIRSAGYCACFACSKLVSHRMISRVQAVVTACVASIHEVDVFFKIAAAIGVSRPCLMQLRAQIELGCGRLYLHCHQITSAHWCSFSTLFNG